MSVATDRHPDEVAAHASAKGIAALELDWPTSDADSHVGLFSQIGYFVHDLGTWFRDAFTPGASHSTGSVIKSDSCGLSLPTGPTATSTANLS
ncbi:MAG: hypothetical protein ORO03_06310, partial [Alphaproteobacteria bacterium]|nr:hypothetical protein [Alphaproteobacteria bacterium]